MSADGAVRAILQTTLGPAEPSAGSQADRVHQELRRALLLGQHPYGERLVEEQLAERFEISRTPVREALRRLEGDGHVVRDPAGGMRPNAPRVSTMRDIYEVRIVIEDLVVGRAAAGGDVIDTEGLIALRDEWAELQARWPELATDAELPEFVHADEGFHEALARMSGNRVVERYLRDVNERIRVLRIYDFLTADRVEVTIAEHLEIAEAICAGKVDAAGLLMRAHVEASAAVVEKRVGDLLTRMFDDQETRQ